MVFRPFGFLVTSLCFNSFVSGLDVGHTHSHQANLRFFLWPFGGGDDTSDMKDEIANLKATEDERAAKEEEAREKVEGAQQMEAKREEEQLSYIPGVKNMTTAQEALSMLGVCGKTPCVCCNEAEIHNAMIYGAKASNNELCQKGFQKFYCALKCRVDSDTFSTVDDSSKLVHVSLCGKDCLQVAAMCLLGPEVAPTQPELNALRGNDGKTFAAPLFLEKQGESVAPKQDGKLIQSEVTVLHKAQNKTEAIHNHVGTKRPRSTLLREQLSFQSQRRVQTPKESSPTLHHLKKSGIGLVFGQESPNSNQAAVAQKDAPPAPVSEQRQCGSLKFPPIPWLQSDGSLEDYTVSVGAVSRVNITTHRSSCLIASETPT